MILFFLSAESIDAESSRWFGRPAKEIAFRESKLLLGLYCEGAKSIFPDLSEPPTGISLTFKDKEQCLDFFNRFLTYGSGIWLEPNQTKEALELTKDLPYKLFMFRDPNGGGNAAGYEPPLGAILACDDVLRIKLTLA